MNTYVGTAKIVPDSRMPRRFSSVIDQPPATEISTRAGCKLRIRRRDREHARRDRHRHGQDVVRPTAPLPRSARPRRPGSRARRCRRRRRSGTPDRLPVRERDDRQQRAIASAIAIECVSAPVPAATSTSRISSVAYALDDSASDENTASAFVLGSRCSSASSDEIGDPTATLRTCVQKRSPRSAAPSPAPSPGRCPRPRRARSGARCRAPGARTACPASARGRSPCPRRPGGRSRGDANATRLGDRGGRSGPAR